MPTAAPHAVRFSTAGLPAPRRVALWEQHNAHALIGLRCRVGGDDALEATELNLQLEHLHVARVRATAHTVERRAEEVRRHPADALAVYLPVAGDAVFAAEGAAVALRPGQVLVCDADRPFARRFTHGLEEVVVKVPRTALRELAGRGVPRAPLVRDAGSAGGAGRTLVRLVTAALRPATGEALDEALVVALLATLTGGRAEDIASLHAANARTFIVEHLADPGLGAARVAAAVGISERHLSRAFAATGESLPQFVLARRLERAHALLQGLDRPAVAQVAARCGFGSVTYFATVFRTRFGVSPSEARRAGR